MCADRFRCFRIRESARFKVPSRNGRRNFLEETTYGVIERGRSSKSTWGEPRRNPHANTIYLRRRLPPAPPAASAPSGEAKAKPTVTFPGKWNAKSWTARREPRRPRHWATKLSRSRKGFPISLNGALIVIPRAGGGGERNGRCLKCDNSAGRQFSIGERRTDSRRSCFRYLLSIPPPLPFPAPHPRAL